MMAMPIGAPRVAGAATSPKLLFNNNRNHGPGMTQAENPPPPSPTSPSSPSNEPDQRPLRPNSDAVISGIPAAPIPYLPYSRRSSPS
jgi:hypothetical protein